MAWFCMHIAYYNISSDIDIKIKAGFQHLSTVFLTRPEIQRVGFTVVLIWAVEASQIHPATVQLGIFGFWQERILLLKHLEHFFSLYDNQFTDSKICFPVIFQFSKALGVARLFECLLVGAFSGCVLNNYSWQWTWNQGTKLPWWPYNSQKGPFGGSCFVMFWQV